MAESRLVSRVRLLEYPALLEFLVNQAAATIAVPVDRHGTIHAAALRYFHTEDPLALYFITERNSEKCTLLRRDDEVFAACVIGTEVGTPFSLQMRGRIHMVDPARHTEVVSGYYQKRGDRGHDISDHASVLLKFTPTWARFTDYSKGYDRTFLDLSHKD